jgi:RNA polymerase primary sigma factor
MIKKNKTIDTFELSSQIYFNEISNFKSLSLDEEMVLWERYKKDNDLIARDKLITSNLKFVASVARNYQGRGLSYADLIAEGNCGLLKAFDKFDYKKGYKTISYSVWWIRQAILDALDRRNGINGEDLPCDFEKQTGDDDEILIVDVPKNNDFIEDDEKVNSLEDIKNMAYTLVETLTEREQNIIMDYYGMSGSSKTLEEIGDDLGLTKERVRQIKEKALKKLRAEALSNSVTSDIYK